MLFHLMLIWPTQKKYGVLSGVNQLRVFPDLFQTFSVQITGLSSHKILVGTEAHQRHSANTMAWGQWGPRVSLSQYCRDKKINKIVFNSLLIGSYPEGASHQIWEIRQKDPKGQEGTSKIISKE